MDTGEFLFLYSDEIKRLLNRFHEHVAGRVDKEYIGVCCREDDEWTADVAMDKYLQFMIEALELHKKGTDNIAA
jgi:hypothetical protein